MEKIVIHTFGSSTPALSWILLVNGLENLAYYGFRSIMVIFLIDQSTGGMGWSTNEALSLYGEFTAYVYLSMFLGGFCADFIFGSHKTTVIGIILMIIGYIGVTINQDRYMYVAMGFIAVGSGLFRPNILTIIVHQLKNMTEQFDSGFTAQYLIMNLGAACGGAAVGYISTMFGWNSGFAFSAAIAFFALLLLITRQKLFVSEVKKLNLTSTNNNSIFSGIGIVLITTALAIIFWTFFEVGGGKLYNLHPEEMSEINSVINALTVVLTCIVCFFLWSRFKINPWYKIAFGFTLFALGWLVLTRNVITSLDVKQTLILVMVIHAIAEVFCAAILISLIAKYGYLPLISSSFAIHLFSTAIAMSLAGQIVESDVQFETFAWVSLVIGILLLIPQFLFKKRKFVEAAVAQ